MAKITLWMYILKNWNTVWGWFALTLALRIVVDVGTETVQFLQMLADGKVQLNWNSLLTFAFTALVSIANLILTATSTAFQKAKDKAAASKTPTADTSPSI